ncbi:hypothetical protein N7492_001649 [Penicillium capsulatum]|uniref:Vacuolar calcium ion transporter n=1 Tax=Penicillium capsulatum TaxID=69766 RepID=A0A9W9IRZ3_9EURO|nr:hypothetical protein N7492_001649 [Penicillium capsulatum]KAJ6129298.1 hypothetical protein N7512_002078 [Penicillium capsulatum]
MSSSEHVGSRRAPDTSYRNKPQASSPWSQLADLGALPTQTGVDARSGYVLAVLLPLAAAARVFDWHSLVVLVVNLGAIGFLSDIISSTADDLADQLGHLQGALIGATLGNTVELTSGLLALAHGDIIFAQSVMVGSILSDILLIFGCCLVTASYNRHILEFNSALAKTLSSLMMITAVTMLLPTALYSSFPVSELDDRVLVFSRATAFVLFALYGGYLYFHMGTHKHMFLEEDGSSHGGEDEDDEENDSTPSTPKPDLSSGPAMASAVIRLAAAVAATIFCTEMILEDTNDMVNTLGFSKIFIAVIIIPIASNSTEGTAVISAARSGDTDSAIRVIVDSILQIGLFVIPFMVVVGWAIGQPMTLFYDSFQSGIMFLAVLVVNHLLRDGQYAYIHGAMLITL